MDVNLISEVYRNLTMDSDLVNENVIFFVLFYCFVLGRQSMLSILFE